MARRFTLLLSAVLLAASLSSYASTSANFSLQKPHVFGVGEHLVISKSAPEYTSISLQQPEIQKLDLTVDFESWQAFGIDGEPYLPKEGAPVIPQVTRFYRIPNTGSVELIIKDAQFRLDDSVNPYPYHPEDRAFSRDARDPAIYARNAWYPEAIAEISAPMIFRDFRVVCVSLHPVQVNPVTHQARFYDNIDVEIVANSDPGVNELLNPRRPSGSFAPAYRSMIPNLEDSALDEVTTTPGTYMIIANTNASITPFVEALAEWKMRKGMDVVLDRRPDWDAGEMITAIQSMYNNADPPLEFVCLIGDPAADIGVPSSDSDHPFALGNNGDDIEDIGVGRLSGVTIAELATINAKIFAYERDPYMDDTAWFTRAFLYAGVGFSVASNWTWAQWADQVLSIHTGMDNNEVGMHDGGVDEAYISSVLEEGACLFLWRGAWVGEMQNSAAYCNTGRRLPICFTITCGTGDFTEGTSLSEAWLTAGTPASLQGAVCGIGMQTWSTHPPENYTLGGGFVYAIAAQGLEYLGHCLNSAKVWLSATWGPGSSSAADFSIWCNLMGDPGLSIWTDIPVVMDATHPIALNVGMHGLEVVVTVDGTTTPVEDALVVAWKGTINDPETYVKALTDENGKVWLPISIETPGELRLTVVKRNHKPYYVNIPCMAANQMLGLDSAELDDDNAGGTSGNNDGMMNPGEMIDIDLTMKNYGTTSTAVNVYAAVVSGNPNVQVVTGTTSFDDIPAGAAAVCNSPLRISVAPTMQHEESATLAITVTTSSSISTDFLELTCRSGAVEYVNHALSGPAFQPGTTSELQVTIKNSGLMALQNATAELASLSPFVSVSGEGSYGTIAAGQFAVNTTSHFQITANALTFRGHQASLLLILRTPQGFCDSTSFIVPVGNATSADPCGPDGKGYYAYDNTDIAYEAHPEFEYINISAGLGTDLNLNDPGAQDAITPVYSKAMELPFPFTYYGTSFDSITVCSNGWLAFGKQDWNDAFRSYPIPAMTAPSAMVAPYWYDLRTDQSNQGVWTYYDQTNHRYIIQWKASASAILDFEVILFDTSAYPTFDGNGMILFQYQDAQVVASGPGISVGIQDRLSTTGLRYNYSTTYSPGAATIVDGRAILFTTNARNLAGSIAGVVTDAETSAPMEGVTVTIVGTNYQSVTDAAGSYLFDAVIIGTKNLKASFPRYNDATVENILVLEDETATANMSMLHPEFRLSSDEIQLTVPPDAASAEFEIINDGNGPLAYDISVAYLGDGEPVDAWGTIEEINITEATGNSQILGCEFAGDYWYASASGAGGDNLLYKFDLDGNYMGSVIQPSSSDFGWYDMAWDGQYLYGGEDGNALLTGVDQNGIVRATIPSPLNPARAIAYDPETDHFWVGDLIQNIYEIDRAGTVISEISNAGTGELHITGLAWWPNAPEGFKLYAFSQDGTGTLMKVTAFHPATHLRRDITSLEGPAGERAGGCAITSDWNSALVVFGAIHQNVSADRLVIHQVEFDNTWYTVSPIQGETDGGTADAINVSFNVDDLRTDTYRIAVSIYNEVIDSTIVLPVTLGYLQPIDPRNPAAGTPTEYVLHQNYPNPFNPATTIEYDLKTAGQTVLAVYNLVGQEVARLVDGPQSAGRHAVQFEGAALPSGVYFYHLTSGGFAATAKMVLMK